MMRGFSILEVLVASAIMSSAVLAVTLLVLGVPDVLEHARMRQDAVAVAEGAYLRAQARGAEAFGSIESEHGTERGFAVSLDTQAQSDGGALHITAAAAWSDGARSTGVRGILTDYAHASSYACSPLLIGEWEHPARTGLFPVSGSFPPLHAVAASRTHVAAAASSTKSLQEPSLFLSSVDGDAAPQPMRAYDSATSTKVGYIALALSRAHLFALSAHECSAASCASLDVFPLQGPLVPIASYPIPSARSIAYADSRLYIGLRSLASGPEFLVLDVSDPARPLRIGSMETGSTVNDILIAGTDAYLATADNSIAGNRAVMAVAIAEPSELMRPRASGRPPGAGIAQVLARSGPNLFLGRSAPLNSKELYRFHSGDLVHPYAGTDLSSSVAGLLARGSALLALSRTGLERFDTSDAAGLADLAIDAILAKDEHANALACGGRAAYIAGSTGESGMLLMLSGT